ncbi:MAG: efflux RND transporter periplasmic adaptor subunit [Armatimonadota bacterium]|nr:efflux RND transporter periplasmic adaptor subunit [Armatimonadota bacterium]MDR5696799.1 efflux RND transporter periplasmic adaptor subunit [Armatimonadota bacterium]
MRKSSWVVAAVMVVGLLGWRGIEAVRPRPDAPARAAGAVRQPMTVQVAPAARHNLARWASYSGEVRAHSTVDVFPRISGVVAEVRVREGDLVAAGQVVARLDPREFRFQAEQARAAVNTQRVQVEQARAAVRTQRLQVEQARAGLATQRARLAQLLAGPAPEQIRQAEEQVRQAKAAVEFSAAQLRRTEELFEQGFVARQAVDSARMDYEVQQARLRAAEAQLNLLRQGPRAEEVEVARGQLRQAEVAFQQAQSQAAQAEVALRQAESVLAQSEVSLRQAETLLAESAVRAPAEGVVARRAVDPGDTVTPSTLLMQVVDIDPVEIAAPVSERDLGRVAVGMPAAVRVDALPDRMFAGRLARVGPVLATETRTAEIRVEVANPDASLRPGMAARVELVLEQRLGVIAVPIEAVVEREGRRVVFVVTDGLAQARQVETGLTDGMRIEIVRGLRPGENVVVTGQETLRDGTQVLVAGPGTSPRGPRRVPTRPGGDRP